MSIEWHTRQDELEMCALEKKLNNTCSKKKLVEFLVFACVEKTDSRPHGMSF